MDHANKIVTRLIVTSAATIVVVVALFSYMYQLVGQGQRLNNENLKIERLAGEILRLDEALTMSAQAGALSGDPKWEARYDELDKGLSKALLEMKLLTSEKSISETEKANDTLIRLERDAFRLAKSKQIERATDLIQSETYLNAKRAYSEGIFKLLSAARRDSQRLIDANQNTILQLVVAAFFLIVALSFAWYYTVRAVQVWSREKAAQLVHSAKMSSLGEMAGGIAHEINNPLSIILGKAGLIKRSLKRDGLVVEELERDVAKIEDTVYRITHIIRGLRNFSRNAEEDMPAPASLAQIIADTLELCGERFKHQHITLTTHLNEDAVLNCRAPQISQVILNLLNNACDAIEGLDEKWIRLEVHRLNDKVLISVIDAGLGIPQKVAQKIMQPFFTTKELGRGTGLGLSISRGIAQAHGGDLTYDLFEGHTRFTLSLSTSSGSKA
ncbi:MAG: sensor histidine kinase [Bacteriovoracia bacterium]